MFVLSFARNAEGDHRDSFSHYYVANIEIKDFNILMDGKSFFDLPVNDYTIGNLLNFAYFKDNYRLIAIDLSKQTKLKNTQQLILLVNLKNKTTEQQCFSSLKNQKNLLLSFCKMLSISYKNGYAKYCKFVKQFWKWMFKILQQKDSTLLTVNQRILIHITIQ